MKQKKPGQPGSAVATSNVSPADSRASEKARRLSQRQDFVETSGGVVDLPAQIREVARLANRSGMDGLELVDAEFYGGLTPGIKLTYWARPDNTASPRCPTDTTELALDSQVHPEENPGEV